MIINRANLQRLLDLIEKLSKKQFNIQTQYKFLKIKNSLQEEAKIYTTQLSILGSFIVTDENGEFVKLPDGGYKIKEETKQDCAKVVEELNNLQITIPDLYFTLEELECLSLTLEELDILQPFIKF